MLAHNKKIYIISFYIGKGNTDTGNRLFGQNIKISKIRKKIIRMKIKINKKVK